MPDEEGLDSSGSRSRLRPTIVRRYFRKDSVDKINQIFSFTFIYRTLNADGELILEENRGFQADATSLIRTCEALFLLAGLEPRGGSTVLSRKLPLDNSAEQMIFRSLNRC